MSYHYYSIDGYGINDNRISDSYPVENVRRLLDCAPDFKELVHSLMEENDFDEDDYQSYIDISDHFDAPITSILSIVREVIFEAEGINLCVCEDFDGVVYLVETPSYPWSIPERHRDLTPESVSEIINKYINILCGYGICCNYLCCENGG